MKDILKEQYIELLKRYISIGVPKGSSILLSPSIALDFVSEIEQIGIVILGCDCWYLEEGADGQSYLVEDLGVDFSVDYETINGPTPVQDSAESVRKFIRKGLPPNTMYLSFVTSASTVWLHEALGLVK